MSVQLFDFEVRIVDTDFSRVFTAATPGKAKWKYRLMLDSWDDDIFLAMRARKLGRALPDPREAYASRSAIASKAAAELLTVVGMAVRLEEDDGSITVTKTRSLPWMLGHGEWVVKVEGKSGGWITTRIKPL